MTLTPADRELLARKGISEARINEQLHDFATGFPYLRLSAAASVEHGILVSTDAELKMYAATWDTYRNDGQKKIIKFVPASGAASRMFKQLYEFAEATYEIPVTEFEKTFFDHLTEFAFYDALDAACLRTTGRSVAALCEAGAYKTVVRCLLEPHGLNYGNLPKGLLLFHKYTDGTVRTPVEEHLVEAAAYAAGRTEADIHFTVSPEHRPLFEQLIGEKIAHYNKVCRVNYAVSYSEQKPSTDTIAVGSDNEPLRENGELLFRPGGHGALIENLNDLDADIVFIKNIDNVVPDRYKPVTTRYKQLIAGVLVGLQQQAFAYLRMLDSGQYTQAQVLEVLQFLQKRLFCKNPEVKHLEDSELVLYLKRKLNRPIRVCGMVRNVGEPGGGPFLAYNSDGTISLQILESSQIDMTDADKRRMFEQGTYFNPVDLVCGIRNYQGEKFDLTRYVDKTTGFISRKSKNGVELKALELPGLWNGAMSDWNTVFVEVPLETFNPVKTVNDLLRKEHQ
ncbi:MAG: DUF4301 family protein [Prevotellaceae bacterium]|jgi:hypothetical protein|nr:DUF4301 family protein [Prevotellaceae bacterium]